MKLTARDLSLEGLDGLSGTEALCLFIREDERPLKGSAGLADWRMCGKLSEVLLDGFFAGHPDEKLLLPTEGRLATPRLFAFGCGLASELSEERLSKTLSHAAQTLTRAGVRSVGLELPGAGRLPDEERVRLWSHGFGAAFGGDAVVVLAEKPLAKLLPAQLPSIAL